MCFFLEILRHSLDININSLSVSYVIHFWAKKISANCVDRIPRDATPGINANSYSRVCKPMLPWGGAQGWGTTWGMEVSEPSRR